MDLSLEGHQFTWTKSRGTDHALEERLDRALVNPSWFDFFLDAKLLNLIATHSDHNPILLACEQIQQRRKMFSFRFENSWLKEEGIEDVVTRGWQKGHRQNLIHCIGTCAGELGTWNRLRGKNHKERLAECLATMDCYRDAQDTVSSSRYLEAQKEYNKLIVSDEIFWK
ncbi:uncharacterized protein LOC131632019 [Vicia villosa]|uniref:uncharacterized protein LOC131632019 n=1 Tax=Vicia villosa TaxID=3911 RepID=UPI00273B448C|nr:uncharacterized protein LOC131632019 [Vicia villosa]